MGGMIMTRKSIDVRIIGDPARIGAAMDSARVNCVRRELDKLPPEERVRLIDRLVRRYDARY